MSRPPLVAPRLRNDTGEQLDWKGVRAVLGEGRVNGGDAVEMQLDRTELGSSSVLGLRLGQGRWLTCRIDAVGSHAYRLDDGLTAVVEVATRKLGGREVIVRSNVVFHNMTDHALVVSGCDLTVASGYELVVGAGQRRPVPFEALHLSLQLCPDTNMYALSEKSLVPATLLQRTPERAGHATIREAYDVFRCRHKHNGADWTWAVEVNGQLSSDSARAWKWEIWCRAPLTLRNLLHTACAFRLVNKRGLEEETLYEGHLEKGSSQQLHRLRDVELLYLQLKVGFLASNFLEPHSSCHAAIAMPLTCRDVYCVLLTACCANFSCNFFMLVSKGSWL